MNTKSSFWKIIKILPRKEFGLYNNPRLGFHKEDRIRFNLTKLNLSEPVPIAEYCQRNSYHQLVNYTDTNS